MWSYYGAKFLLAPHYPHPIMNDLIEPACGAAYFSLLHFEKNVFLYDKSPTIISIWHFLQEASIDDIKRLPKLPAGTRIERSMFDCDGEYNLMKFMIVQAAFGGNNVVSKWGAIRFDVNVKRVIANLHKIKHWKIQLSDYRDIPNRPATWFVDFPYFNGGHKYPFSNRKIDFNHASEWCRSREGQVIVCENSSAHWLPFVPLKETIGVAHKTQEVIWTNYHTHFNNLQIKMDLA